MTQRNAETHMAGQTVPVPHRYLVEMMSPAISSLLPNFEGMGLAQPKWVMTYRTPGTQIVDRRGGVVWQSCAVCPLWQRGWPPL